jgi:hypothetical protein
MSQKRLFWSIVLCFLAATPVSRAVARDGGNFLDAIGTPTVAPGALTAAPPTDNTVPHWSSAFTSSQVTYPFSMVGTNPASGSATTTVPVALIPLQFVFADGRSLDATPTVAATLASPIFQAFGYSSGTTQFGDAIMRAEFWSSVSTTSPDWHVLLGTPTVYPTQVIHVPAGQAVEVVDPVSQKLFAATDAGWLQGRVNDITHKLQIPPTTLAIFQTYHSFMRTANGRAFFLGYHFAARDSGANGNQPVRTGIVSAWVDPGILPLIEDIDTLSHEVSEWLNDPFGDTPVPPFELPWDVGCQANLETGDFIAILGPPNEDFPITLSGFTYHLQNEALLPWFSREAPSSAIGGAYSYPDTTILVSPSPAAAPGHKCP